MYNVNFSYFYHSNEAPGGFVRVIKFPVGAESSLVSLALFYSEKIHFKGTWIDESTPNWL